MILVAIEKIGELLEDFSGQCEGMNGSDGAVKSMLSIGSMLYCCRSVAKTCCCRSRVGMCLLQERVVTCFM